MSILNWFRKRREKKAAAIRERVLAAQQHAKVYRLKRDALRKQLNRWYAHHNEETDMGDLQ